MRAIILAAGSGRRMQEELPKSLLEVGGKSLLRRNLEALGAVGIREAVVVVGYEQEKIREQIGSRCGGVQVQYVENPRYQEGAILSLWAARNWLIQDVVIMDADVFYEIDVLARLIFFRRGNAVLIDESVAFKDEEMVLLASNRRVWHIGKKPDPKSVESAETVGEHVGFIKLTREGAQRLLGIMEDMIHRGQTDAEHEAAYHRLMEVYPVGFMSVRGLAWTEVDFKEDVEQAKKILPKLTPPLFFNRWLAKLWLYRIAQLGLSPNQWTAVGFLLGMLANACFVQGGTFFLVLGGLLFQFFYVVDNWDGDVARLTGRTSTWGGWFDLSTDGIVQTLLPLCLALGLARQGQGNWMMVGWVATMGVAISTLLAGWQCARGFGPAVFSDRGLPASWEKEPQWKQRLRINCTSENLSLLILLVAIFDWRTILLPLMAVGTHVWWVLTLCLTWKRLVGQEELQVSA